MKAEGGRRKGADASAPGRKLRLDSRAVLPVLVIVAALARILFFIDMADTPLPRLHDWKETDMAFFDEWATSIANGDLLTDRSLHPHHGWHDMLAGRYLSANDRPLQGGAMRAVWDDWYGGKRFHQEPAYAYLLGTVYAVGGNAWWMLVLQGLMGIGAAVLLFLTTRRLFDQTTALVATILTLLFGPLLFYEFLLLRVTLVLFTGLLALYLTVRALEEEKTRWFLLAGLALGVAFLVKSTVLLFFLAIALFVVLKGRGAGAGWRQAGLMAAGMVVPILPAIVRNLVVGAPALQFSSVAAITFINANAPDFTPGTGFYISKYAIPVMVQSHDSLVAAAADTISFHDGLLSYPGMLVKKFLAFFSPTEIPNNANYHYFSRFSFVLTYAQLSFWWIGLPAVGGMVIAVRNWRRHLPLYAYLVCGLVPIVIFYNLSRFRAPLVPFLAPFAALALVTLARSVRERGYREVAIILAAAVLTASATYAAAPPASPVVREADYVIGNRQWETLARTAYEEGDKERALQTLLTGLEATPYELKTSTGGDSRWRKSLGRSFGRLHLQAAALAHELGDESTSARQLEQARALHELTQ